MGEGQRVGSMSCCLPYTAERRKPRRGARVRWASHRLLLRVDGCRRELCLVWAFVWYSINKRKDNAANSGRARDGRRARGPPFRLRVAVRGGAVQVEFSCDP